MTLPGSAVSPVDFPVASLYEAACKGQASTDDMARLSTVFVAPGATVGPAGKSKFKFDAKQVQATDTGLISLIPGFLEVLPAEIKIHSFFVRNEESTKLWGLVPAKNHTREALSAGTIKQWILDYGAKLLVLDENLKMAMDAYALRGGKVILLEGKDPQHGRPELIKLVIDLTTRVGAMDATGKIDYKERDFVHNVRMDEHLADYFPALEAWPGRDIFDQVVKARMDRPDTFRMGDGVKLDKATGRVLSDKEGVFLVSESKVISVSGEQVIEGDVDLASGNIVAMGNVTIHGTVMPGFSVVAKGNVHISGNIQEGTVRCGGDLVLEGGILGNPANPIEVGGKVVANFLSNVTLRCQGDVDIAQYIMNSEVMANGHVKAVTEKKGRVFGGTVSGRLGIEVFEAGNPKGVRTVFVAGIDHDTARVVNDLQEKIKANNDLILKHKSNLGSQYFADAQIFFKRLPASKLPMVKQTIDELRKAIEARKLLDAEFAKYAGAHIRNKAATVTIHHQGYEGTVIQIANYTLIPKVVATPTRFVVEGVDIVPTSLKA